MSDVVVIGGGLAGLSTAHRLMRLGVDVRVYERSARAGGHVRTVQREGWRHEQGPNSFLGSATPLFDLSSELGLTPVRARPTASRRYLFVNGNLHSLPSDPLRLLTSPVLPPTAKARMLLEPLVRGGGEETSTVRDFFDKRLGLVATEHLVDAFVGGVYAGDIDQLGVAAAFPRLVRFVQDHGSLLRGAIAASKATGGGRRGTWSFVGGLGDLAASLADALGDRLHLQTDVVPERDGLGWRVDGKRASHLVVATPAFAAAELMQSTVPSLAAQLDQVAYAPVAGVHLLIPRERVTHPLDGFGFLAPSREKLRLLGCIWNSSLFDVCDSDYVALTAMCGGRDPATYALDDKQLVEAVLSDLGRTIGLCGPPADVAVVRHDRAIPQPGTNHLTWLRAVTSDLSSQPGLHVTGNYLKGVSMGETVAHGEETARRIAEELGVVGHPGFGSTGGVDSVGESESLGGVDSVGGENSNGGTASTGWTDSNGTLRSTGGSGLPSTSDTSDRSDSSANGPGSPSRTASGRATGGTAP